MSAPAGVKRFYRAVSVEPAQAPGFLVKLDGRHLRTPGGEVFCVPSALLAHACAAEWDRQGDAIQPLAMALTRLVNVAIDRGEVSREALLDHVSAYAGTDLIAHRADQPAKLVARQAALWDPLVRYAREALDLPIAPVVGVGLSPAAERSQMGARARAGRLDAFHLTGLAHGAGLSGSAVIGFAMMHGALGVQDAFAAAALDDIYQAEVWGNDEEAEARLAQLKADLTALDAYFAALGRPA
jgi:chaperone required for assembly of F1-ATPase